MRPRQILDSMSKSEIKTMYETYLEKYPNDWVQFDEGIISEAVSRKLSRFIKKYHESKNGVTA